MRYLILGSSDINTAMVWGVVDADNTAQAERFAEDHNGQTGYPFNDGFAPYFEPVCLDALPHFVLTQTANIPAMPPDTSRESYDAFMDACRSQGYERHPGSLINGVDGYYTVAFRESGPVVEFAANEDNRESKKPFAAGWGLDAYAMYLELVTSAPEDDDL